MKLLTKEITKKALEQYDKGSDMDEQMIIAKFFNPMGSWTWYLMNLANDEDCAWGIVDGNAVEMGSFSIKELQDVKLPFGLGIERDLYFEPIKADELWKELNA
jgi:hypothetical protein|tara:strand:+ start:812 stop:1120 length:309 start_codon:yes stop_codon:yes gene_type:complete